MVMVNHPPPSRSWHRPLGFVRSTLLIISLAVSTLAKPANPTIVLNTPALGSVTSCASFIASWTVLRTTADDDVQTAINNTYIGIWATNVGVDQTAVHDTPTIPGSPIRRSPRLSTRQQMIPSPVTTNVTIQAVPLVSGTPSGNFYTWGPVMLPPNQYYVMYLQSLPGHRGGLDVSVHSDKFFVQAGATTSCFAGIVTDSLTVTSTSSAASSLPSATSNPTGAITGPPTNKKNHTGAIVGGVIGGVVLLGLIAFIICRCLRRRRSDKTQELGDFLATRGVNPYGRRSFTTIERRASSYDPSKYGGILAAIGIHSPSSEKPSTSESRHPGSHYPRRFSYQRQPDDHLDGADAKRTSFSKFRSSGPAMTDMATILASDPVAEAAAAEKTATRRSKSSSITTFAQSMANVPYRPYSTSSAGHDDPDAGVSRRTSHHTGGGRHSHTRAGSSEQGGRHSVQMHTRAGSSEQGGRHSVQMVQRASSEQGGRHSLQVVQRGSERYSMSPVNHSALGGAQEETEPEVMVWTGPTHNRASTSMSGGGGGGGEPRSSDASEFGALAATDQGALAAPDQGALAAPDQGALAATDQGALAATDQGAPLVRKKSAATSGKSRSSIARKKAPDLPLPKDGALDAGIPAPPSAYITPTHSNGESTSTINTGASAYVPSQAAAREKRAADVMPYQNGRRSSEVFGPGTSAPGPSNAFDAFAGVKDGPVHILMPDLPPDQADS